MSKCSLAAQLRNSEEALATQSEPETSLSPILRLLPWLQYHGDWVHEDQDLRAGFYTGKMRELLATRNGHSGTDPYHSSRGAWRKALPFFLTSIQAKWGFVASLLKAVLG